MIEDLCWRVEELFCIGCFAMLYLHSALTTAVESVTESRYFIDNGKKIMTELKRVESFPKQRLPATRTATQENWLVLYKPSTHVIKTGQHRTPFFS